MAQTVKYACSKYPQISDAGRGKSSAFFFTSELRPISSMRMNVVIFCWMIVIIKFNRGRDAKTEIP